jgi:hypothetical protein
MTSTTVHLAVRQLALSILGSQEVIPFHLFQHCFSVRPGTNAAISFQFLPPCVFTASFSLLSSAAFHLPVRPLARSGLESTSSFHLLQHCLLVRPGTSAAISTQFLPPCVCTAAASLMTSTAVHFPVRPLARSMLGSETFFHLLLHCFFVRPGTSAATVAQSILYSLLYSLPYFFSQAFVTAIFRFASSSGVQ